MALTPLVALAIGSLVGTGASLAISKLTGPKIPKAPEAAPPLAPTLLTPPPASTVGANAPAARRAATQQRKRAAGAGGRADTIVTGPLGLTTPPGEAPVKTLLGQ